MCIVVWVRPAGMGRRLQVQKKPYLVASKRQQKGCVIVNAAAKLAAKLAVKLAAKQAAKLQKRAMMLSGVLCWVDGLRESVNVCVSRCRVRV